MNTPARPRRVSPTLAKSLRRLHRYTGLAMLGPVLLLAVTGALLEFTSPLQLGSQGVPFRWVHASYAIAMPAQGVQSGGVTQLGQRLFVGDRHLAVQGQLQGAQALELIDMVFMSDELLIVPRDPGIAVERSKLPAYAAVGQTTDGDWVLDTGAGILFSADLGASWSPSDPLRLSVSWLHTRAVAADPQWQRRFGAAHVSWERWLLDLHSGRFFGSIGVWVMSIAALALVLLAISGLLVWLKQFRYRP